MMGGTTSATPKIIQLPEVDVPYSELNYPPLKAPKTKKTIVCNPSLFTEVDKKARSTPRKLASSYQDLIKHLTAGLQNEVQKVRSIFVWLASQRIMDDNYDEVMDANTPLGYMRLIQEERGTYEKFFALLCRAAKLSCVVVQGNVKSATYEVGDMDIECVYGYWNIVYVDGSWRIVNPKWAMLSIGNYDNGRWHMLEKDGKSSKQKSTQGSLEYVYSMDEFYFMTDPEQHIFRCLPCDKKYQLMGEPWTMEKFLSVPLVENEYFSSGVTLPDDLKGIITAADGQAELNLKVSTENANLRYELYFEQKKKKTLSFRKQLFRYVFLTKERNARIFFVRFPTIGKYRLTILSDIDMPLCNFRIDCTSVSLSCEPFPKTPDIGWGFGETARRAGLHSPSHEGGVVTTDSKKSIDFKFTTKKDVMVQANLLHNEVSSKRLEGFVKQGRDEAGKLTVTVDLPSTPKPNEFALEINAKNKKDEPFKNVANYLITTENRRPKDKKVTLQGTVNHVTNGVLQKDASSQKTPVTCKQGPIRRSPGKTHGVTQSVNSKSNDVSTSTTNGAKVVRTTCLSEKHSSLTKTVISDGCHIGKTQKDITTKEKVEANGNLKSEIAPRSILSKNKTYSFKLKTGEAEELTESCGNLTETSPENTGAIKSPRGVSPVLKVTTEPKRSRSSSPFSTPNNSRRSSRKLSASEQTSNLDDNRHTRLQQMKDAYLGGNSAKETSQSKSPNRQKSCSPRLETETSRINTVSSETIRGLSSSPNHSSRETVKPTVNSPSHPNLRLTTKSPVNQQHAKTVESSGISSKETGKENIVPILSSSNVQDGTKMNTKDVSYSDIRIKKAKMKDNEQMIGQGVSSCENKMKNGLSDTDNSADNTLGEHIDESKTQTKTVNHLVPNGPSNIKCMSRNRTASSLHYQPKSQTQKHLRIEKDKLAVPLEQVPKSKAERGKVKSTSPISHRKSPDRGKQADVLYQDLEKAIESRQITEIDKVLGEAGVVSPNPKLVQLKAKAETIRSVIKRPNKYMHEIMAVNQATIAEIHSYSHPKPVVQDVMRATFLLLGERGAKLRKWHYIQQLMRRSSKEGLVMRIEEFDVNSISLELAHYVKALLDNYDADEVRLTSSGAGAFYNWCRNIISEVEKNAQKTSAN